MARIKFNGPQTVLRLPSIGVEVLRGDEYGVPAALAEQLLAWADVDVDVFPDGEPVQRPVVPEPPRDGVGSGRAAWADYADSIGIPVEMRWSRERIIEACEQATAPAVEAEREPEEEAGVADDPDKNHEEKEKEETP